ncbi:ATP-binding cassette permease mdl2 [Yamadazyma tenuis]|uniref:P-loop containing nucleoside triphosphate hydrolase protein n=1 Tax=Candida tenuis (strain ATCC 10573 / BCRC 21748 / CBS 615 / JCM 9827 / NBRC 10315 / NRRL Y-1498 / VKM Y-70) TaxID=590646 RepID=G3B556_CANTC|nr:uncharacterized protein CANTEDRAFT_106537 [Yamadazyma tenuis ATCC 10573]EGV63141.1 hypothetical protein CANTEDRAFT_106537 [Yamadazyma tenuis ATCC 10573]WEJ97041.1 ATP-binding cassette permease mdl2 [Yamadazyma tenuis]
MITYLSTFPASRALTSSNLSHYPGFEVHGYSSLRLFSTSTTRANTSEDISGSTKELSKSIKEHLAKTKEKRAIRAEENKDESDVMKNSFKQNIKTIVRIFKLGAPDTKLFLIALGFILFAVLYPTAAVKLVGAAIDAFNNKAFDEDGNILIWGYKATSVFAVMTPFLVASAVCFWARIWLLKMLGERLVARLRLRVMKHLLRHDSAFFDGEKHKVGDLMSRLASDAYVVSRSLTGNLPDGLKNVLFALISSYMMLSINPLLFGVMMLISPPITFGSVWYGEKIRKISTKLQNATAGLTKISEETLNSVKVVQAFTAESKELNRYSDQLRTVVGVAKKEAFANSNYSVSIYGLYHTGYLACVALGVYFISRGQMSTGDVVAFTMYSELFNGALYSLTTTYLELMKGAGAGVKLFELIDHADQVDAVKGKKIEPNLGKDIEFRDVVFSYPSRPDDAVFKECSFKIPAGSSTCFVAPSGCGKSTVASLLLRSYNINSGQILIGGKDISQYQVRDLRRQVIGIVQQEPILVSGTILENIVYGLTPSQIENVTFEDILEVCKQANCHEFINAFPDKYDTIIGSRGASLSGGQKQRIAIARALIKRPAILVLDEATSALDSRSESLINETLKELTASGRMTIISIAHRLSTISKSEYVVVLGKAGKVVETGRFVELFSDPTSELSKLLDQSSDQLTPKSEKEKPLDINDDLSEVEVIRNMVYDLPFETRRQLLGQLTLEIQDGEVDDIQSLKDKVSSELP